jgi:hypothetical protein
VKLFGNMDLYKAIVLASFVLLPASGGWVYWLNDQIVETKAALARASDQTKEIGALEKQMETVSANQGKTALQTESPNEWFTKIIVSSGGGISPDDFTFPQPHETQVMVGKSKAIDTEVSIDFGKASGTNRNDFKLGRDYIFALIYNCEMQQIWKLRSLEMINGTSEREAVAYKTPPAELEDRWLVKKLTFVKRKPAPGK